MRNLFNWAAARLVAAFAFALPLAAMAATTYSTDHTVTGSETAYTSDAGNANVTWQNFNFRAAVDKDHLAHGYYFYLKDGDTDIGETDSAVKLDSITLTWGSSGTSAGIGLSDTPYLVVTTADDTPVILGVSAAGAPYTYNETSTFVFTDLVLASNAKYRFYFYKNDVTGLSVGATLTGATTGRVNGRFHNTSADRRADYNDICCNGGTGYSVNCSFVVSPLEAGDATVLETSSTAVSVGSVATPVVIEGKVADGVVEVGSAATVSGVFTVCGEATTLKLTDSLTATAFYFPATVTIDASGLTDLDPTGEDASKTTTLLSGALKYTTTPTVVLPAATAGMIYETNITSSGISVTVVKGVDCVETITADTSWSTIKPSGWVDSLVGDKPAITITYAGEDPVTLTFDETVQAGSLTLTGNIVVEASAAATFGTITAGSGSVVEMANVTVSTQAGAGTYRYRSNYPSAVPNGITYAYVGGATDAETVVISGDSYFNNEGTLKTSGFISFANFWTGRDNAKLDVLSGKTTINSSYQKCLRSIIIRDGAEMVNARTLDALSYGSSLTVDVYGTLSMGQTRWTVGDNNAIKIHGGTITGVGEGNNGALDFIGTGSLTADADSTISANVKFRNVLSSVTVNDGVTLTISGVTKPGYDGGGITKKGAGTLKFTSDPYVPGGITVEAGTLAFDTESDVDPVVTYTAAVLNSANMDYAVSNNWKGTVVVSAVAAGTTATQVALNKTGNANSYLTLTNISGNAWCAGSSYTVQPEITLAGDVNFQNGSSYQTVTFRKIAAGTGNLSLKSWSGCKGITYGFTTLDADNYTGTIQLDGSVLAFNVGDILKAGAAVGDKVLPLTVTNSAAVNLDSATLNGKAAGFELREDGVYYTTAYVSINVPKVANTTVAVSVGGTPVSPATEGETTNTYSVVSGSTVTVTYTSDDYEVTGGSFEFTASEDYTVDATAVTTAAYMASITAGETTTKYATLQAAVTAAAAVNNSKILLVGSADGMVAAIPAPASGGRVQFYIAANGNAEGTVNAPAGDYITTTASETVEIGNTDYDATKYTVVEAAVAVTINEARTLYAAMYVGDAVSAAIAGGLGSTIEFVNGTDSTPYVSTLEASGFTVENNVWTFTTLPVAKVTHGVTETSYITLAAAFANAQAGDTIKVLADNTVTNAIVFSVNLTLDLNGYTTTRTAGGHLFEPVSSATFTITDTSDGATGKAVAPAKVILTGSPCTVTLNAGTLESDSVPVYLWGNGEANERVVNINGGKLICNETGTTEAYAVVNLNGTVNMTAGEIESKCSGFYVKNATVSGGTVKIGSESGRKVFYEQVSYTTIAVTGGTFNRDVTHFVDTAEYEVVNNGNGTYTVRANRGWIYEAADYPGYTGSWSNEVEYVNGKAHIEDGNTYTANRPSDGRMVTVEMTLSFDDVNDEDETVGDAKAAVKLATGGFKVYTSEGPDGSVTSVWKSVTIDGLDLSPQVNEDYTFLFVLDLTNTTYTAALITSGGAATNALVLTDGSVTNIPFASRGNVAPVQKIEFIGSGSVTSIEGSYEDVPAPVDVFVVDETIVLTDGSASLSADQAAWLNKLGAKSAVATRLGQLASAQFSAAYLLNLDLMGDFTYEFKVTDITVGDSSVEVEVTLTRTGTYVDDKYAINGTLTLKGTAAIGTPFETIDDVALGFDRNNNFSDGSATSASIVTIDTSETNAKFYKPVIE